jgi:hypothetical protein
VYISQPITYPWPSYALQVGLWIGIVGGLLAFSKRKPHYVESQSNTATADNHADTMHHVPTLLPMVVITLVGFGLRVHALDKLPLIIDEIGFAAHASDILHGQQVPIFAPGHNANPSVYSWLVAGAMALFGQNAFAIRLIPLAFGTLSIPAVYALGRAWWGKRIGMLAAAFLATYPMHIFFSRMSLYNIVDPFFAMLALAYLPHPLTPSPLRREGENTCWILAGILAGIAQYFYHGSRLLLVLIAVYVGLWTIGERKRYNLEIQRDRVTEKSMNENVDTIYRVPTNSILWMIVSFVLVTLPRFAPMLVSGLPLTGNTDTLHLPPDLIDNSWRAVLAWVGQPDTSPFWLSDAPLLQWGALAAFAVGVLVCLRHLYDPRNLVLLVCISLTTIFGGMVWMAAPLYVRYLTAAPAIALLVAVGVEVISYQLSVIRKRIQKVQTAEKRTRSIVSLQGILITLICVQGLYAAWVQPEEAYQRITASQWQENALAIRVATIPDDLSIVFAASPDFGGVQEITLAHYLAAYGRRRSIFVSHTGGSLTPEQSLRLSGGFIILSVYHSPS